MIVGLLAAGAGNRALAAEAPSHVVSSGEVRNGDATATEGSHAALQPYQIVRSLELVQDRLAAGDHASQPMQRKLITMADESFATRESARFENEMNRRALVIYAMSGGNPTTLEKALPHLGKDDPNRRLGEKILFYVNGKPKEAIDAFASVDPMSYPPDVAIYVSLIKGSMLSDVEPANALALLDKARLLAPGTLVEEAALRRSIAVATRLGEAARFVRLSEQYVRSYLRSPYASQFADAFVAGIVELRETVDRKAVVELVGLMDEEQQKVIYLRIARRAAINGLVELAAFAATQAEEIADDPRAELYSSLSSVTSGNVDEVLHKLGAIDRGSLSEGDRQLLDAASVIASELTSTPAEMAAPNPAHGESRVRKVGPAPVIPASVASDRGNESTPGSATLGSGRAVDTGVERAEAVVAATRARLAEIDKMIGEMPK
ncbi:MAG: chemotaxis protein MotC [Rhizobiaceae bacterium]|nr:chemotaxis protein MotC [Rhizobiaceae bacterium]